MGEGLLRDDAQERIRSFGETDIVIGIPSFNNAKTIGHVVKAVHAGCAKYFPGLKTVLIHADGGSADGTADIVRSAAADMTTILVSQGSDTLRKISTLYQGIPGKGSAFRTVFEASRILNAKACAVVDADLRSITPEWIELLIKPVLENGYDFIAPLYHRHKYDGTITNTIIYPMTRALYGRRIRQPIGGDFGFSGALASFYADKPVWDTDVARFGIDIWMTTTAIANGFKTGQSFLGAKIHDAKDPSSDLSSMLHQVVSTMFGLMDEYEGTWREIQNSKPVETFGFTYTVGLEPINVNLPAMVEKFKLGVRELASLYCDIISPEVLMRLTSLSQDSNEIIIISDEIWARVISDFALAVHSRTMKAEHIIKSLTPLYLGKVASLVAETQNMDSDGFEQRIEDLCVVFEHEKQHLVSCWQKN